MDFAIFSRDTIILIVLLLALITFSYKTRKKATVALILSIYISIAVYPFIQSIAEDTLTKSISFAIALVLSFIATRTIVRGNSPDGSRAFIEHLLLSLSNLFLILAILNYSDILSVLPQIKIPFIDLINKVPAWVWFIQPLIVLFIVKKKD